MMKKIVILLLVITSLPCLAQSRYKISFIKFWNDYNDNYAYFEKQGIDWAKVKEIYLPEAALVKNDYEFTKLLEKVVNELHNGHVTLQNNFSDSNRIIPSGSDLVIEKKGDKYIIADVRKGSKAEACGLRPDMHVVKFNGTDITLQLNNFLPKSVKEYNPAMISYACNMLFAGAYNKPREITVKIDSKEQVFHPDAASVTNDESLLSYKILPGNVGYIKINNSLWNYSLISEFDKAIDALLNTKTLILDLTDTPGGGNTTVARAIMGRFISKELPYQKHVIEEKQYGTVRSWIEYVQPRKTIYDKKVVVMAGHWTGSMGEGITIGFDAMKRAKITGTNMAGLLGAIYTAKAANSNVGYSIPFEKMYHINGTPREDFIPAYKTSNSGETYLKALELAGVK